MKCLCRRRLHQTAHCIVNKPAPNSLEMRQQKVHWQTRKYSFQFLQAHVAFICFAYLYASFRKKNVIQFFLPIFRSIRQWRREWALHKMILSFNIEKNEFASDDDDMNASIRHASRLRRHHYISESNGLQLGGIQHQRYRVTGIFFIYSILFYFSSAICASCICRCLRRRDAFLDLVSPPCSQFYRKFRCWICSCVVLSLLFCIIYSRIIIKIYFMYEIELPTRKTAPESQMPYTKPSNCYCMGQFSVECFKNFRFFIVHSTTEVCTFFIAFSSSAKGIRKFFREFPHFFCRLRKNLCVPSNHLHVQCSHFFRFSWVEKCSHSTLNGEEKVRTQDGNEN